MITAQYDADAVAGQPLGTGFFVRAGNEAPLVVRFDDYEITTCVRDTKSGNT